MIEQIITEQHRAMASSAYRKAGKAKGKILDGGLPALLALTLKIVAEEDLPHHLVDERLEELIPSLGWHFTHKFTDLLVGDSSWNHLFHRDRSGGLWPYSRQFS